MSRYLSFCSIHNNYLLNPYRSPLLHSMPPPPPNPPLQCNLIFPIFLQGFSQPHTLTLFSTSAPSVSEDSKSQRDKSVRLRPSNFYPCHNRCTACCNWSCFRWFGKLFCSFVFVAHLHNLWGLGKKKKVLWIVVSLLAIDKLKRNACQTKHFHVSTTVHVKVLEARNTQ